MSKIPLTYEMISRSVAVAAVSALESFLRAIHKLNTTPYVTLL